MENMIGGIKFPDGVAARAASRYHRILDNGDTTPLHGWEFISAADEYSLIVEEEDIEIAAMKAIAWFKDSITS